MTRVAFLDRDGTLNAEIGFVTRPEELRVLPGAAEALRALAANGYRLVVVTNQSGIARGLYSEAGLARIHEELHRRLGELPEAYLHCPHHPEGHGPYSGACDCRKPGAGLLHQARALLDAPFEDGVVIGDSARDVRMAEGLPLRTALVRSGKPADAELGTLRALGIEPDFVAADLPDAVAQVLAADRAGGARGATSGARPRG